MAYKVRSKANVGGVRYGEAFEYWLWHATAVSSMIDELDSEQWMDNFTLKV